MKLFIKNHIKNIKNLSLDDTGLFLFSFLFITVLMFSCPQILLASNHDTFAGDTEIYGSTLTTVEPNVLFIIDTSGSMNDTIVTGDPYDENTTYTTANICDGSSACDTNSVYRWSWWTGAWVEHINDVSSVNCTTAYDNLTTYGLYSGKLSTSGDCTGFWSYSLALGNYINYVEQPGVTMTPKIDVAKDIITDLINTTTGVRIGALRFNSSDDEGGDFITFNSYTTLIKDMDDIFSSPTTNREALVAAVDDLSAGGYTPLAETLFEAMRYYSGGTSFFNGGWQLYESNRIFLSEKLRCLNYRRHVYQR